MEQRNYLAFDIEITKIIELGASWLGERPLGISVAVTLQQKADVTQYLYWYGQGRPNGKPWDKMPQAQVRPLVYHLLDRVKNGFTLLTWNGLHFDLNILAEESGLWEECRRLAWGMVDPMFHFYRTHGYPVGLQAVITAMLGMSKTGTGADAPIKWAMGLYNEVMEYCANDVRVLLKVTQEIESRGLLEWFSATGRLNRWEIPGGRLLTVREVLEMPGKPNPLKPVADFTGWLQEGR